MHVHFPGALDDGKSVASHHARALVRAGVRVTFDGGPDPDAQLAEADLVHVVVDVVDDFAFLRRLVRARRGGRPIVRWWTHRAVLWAQHHGPSRRFAQVLELLGTCNLCYDDTSVEALRRLGVTARVLPMVNPNLTSTIEPEPLPSFFTVLAYLPAECRNFYGGAVLDAVIQRMPDARFLILGDDASNYAGRNNVEVLPFLPDVSRAIRRATVVAQPRVDGRPSRLVYEALCHGRHAVVTARVPCCHHASGAEEFYRVLRQLQRESSFNLEGREYVCEYYDCAQTADRLRECLSELVSPGRMTLTLQGQWQSASVHLRHPQILSRRQFPRPAPDAVPPEHATFRELLTESQYAAAQA